MYAVVFRNATRGTLDGDVLRGQQQRIKPFRINLLKWSSRPRRSYIDENPFGFYPNSKGTEKWWSISGEFTDLQNFLEPFFVPPLLSGQNKLSPKSFFKKKSLQKLKKLIRKSKEIVYFKEKSTALIKLDERKNKYNLINFHSSTRRGFSYQKCGKKDRKSSFQ